MINFIKKIIPLSLIFLIISITSIYATTGKSISDFYEPVISGDIITSAWYNAVNTLKANLDSPNFTGIPTAPMPNAGDDSNQIATTARLNANTGGTGGGELDCYYIESGIYKNDGDSMCNTNYQYIGPNIAGEHGGFCCKINGTTSAASESTVAGSETCYYSEWYTYGEVQDFRCDSGYYLRGVTGEDAGDHRGTWKARYECCKGTSSATPPVDNSNPGTTCGMSGQKGDGVWDEGVMMPEWKCIDILPRNGCPNGYTQNRYYVRPKCHDRGCVQRAYICVKQ